MKRPLDAELKSLSKNLLKMSDLVKDMVGKATSSVVDKDIKLAKEVIQTDAKVNELELKNERKCLKLLALYQPAAVDLRFISMAIKINNDLERMADLAVNIAERAIDLKDVTHESSLVKIPKMAKITERMISDAINSFTCKDAVLAEIVMETDDKVDQLNEEIFSDLLNSIIKKPQNLTKIVALLFISKYLERIADHADNIAEDVIYITKGKSAKH